MPTLIVGNTEIEYEIRFSEKATRKKIVVTPEQVELVAPVGQSEADINDFIQKKRAWVYTKREELIEKALEDPGPSQFVSGAKIPYRGRRMKLRVERTQRDDIQINYANGFYIEIPEHTLPEHQDELIRKALKRWFKERMRQDLQSFIRRYSIKMGLTPSGIRISDLSEFWGTCSASGTLSFNWQLIFAPKLVLEYAVVHELCHLQHREHNKAFWSLLRTHMPAYEVQKQWLQQNESQLCPRKLVEAGFNGPRQL